MINYTKLFAAAKSRGIEELEIYFSQQESTAVRLFDGNVDSYTVSDLSGLAVRGVYEGKIGVVFTEKVTDESTDFIIDTIINTAQIHEKPTDLSLYAGSQKYEHVKTYYEQIELVPMAEKINLAKEIDQLVRAHALIKTIQVNAFSDIKKRVIIKNTKGLDLESVSNVLLYYTYAVASEHEQLKTHGDFAVIRDFDKFDKHEFANAIIKGAVGQLGATIPKSNNYRAILSNEVAYEILSAMASNFSGENVRKGISKLTNKLNSKVASTNVTIYDNPLLEGGLASASFDDDGVATKSKKVIENGILKTFLYDRKTAALVGCESTGNGFKDSTNALVAIRPTNFYIEKGQTSFNDLVKELADGIYITDVSGLHAGISVISGDFSLQSNGFLVENGEITKPVELFTISGNFFELLNSIINVGSDLKFDGSGAGAPSLLIDKIAVSGK